MIFFSVVIPTFNRCHQVVKTIDSVLAQSFKEFEVIIIDDNSTDQTYETLQEYQRNRVLKIIRNEKNLERGASRNIGIKSSIGRYIVFLDSDDIWEINYLKELKAVIDETKAFFIGSKYLLQNKTGSKKKIKEFEKLGSFFYDYQYFLFGNPFGCNFAIKNSAEIELFKESKSYSGLEDWIFLLENAKKFRIFINSTTLISMVDHDGRSMRNNHIALTRKRILSTRLIEKKFKLSRTQKRILWGNTFYFNSVHEFLKGRFKWSRYYLVRSVKYRKLNISSLVLLIKGLIYKSN